jgi:hypothetical protein
VLFVQLALKRLNFEDDKDKTRISLNILKIVTLFDNYCCLGRPPPEASQLAPDDLTLFRTFFKPAVFFNKCCGYGGTACHRFASSACSVGFSSMHLNIGFKRRMWFPKFHGVVAKWIRNVGVFNACKKALWNI